MTKRMMGLMGAAVVAAAMSAGTVMADKDKMADKAVTKVKEMAEGVMIGKPAPAFTLNDQSGNEVSLADFAGKTVVLEWTCSSCPFVKRHYAEDVMTMTSLADAYSEKDVVWLAIDSSNFAKPDEHAKWAEEKGIEYPILADADGTVGRMYGAKTTPHMFVIDPEGNLAYEGAIDNNPRGDAKEEMNYVRAALDAIIAGEKVATTSTKSYGCSVKYSKGV